MLSLKTARFEPENLPLCVYRLKLQTSEMFDQTSKMFDQTLEMFDQTAEMFDQTLEMFDQTGTKNV